MSQTFDITLTARELVAENLLIVRFCRSDGAPLEYQPGQFIQLNLVDAQGIAQRRSYSLAGRPDRPLPDNQFEVAVSLVPGGLAAGQLSAAPLGVVFSATGPLGRFVLPATDTNARYLWLATGTGVTPYRGMLPDLRQRLQAGLEVVLLHGARTAAELLYAPEWMEWATQQTNFRYVPCVSRQWPVALTGAVPGYVQDQLAALVPDPLRDIAYLCGNPGMVDAGFSVLRAAGFGMPRIRREKYLSISSG